jgi:hypothetical protein
MKYTLRLLLPALLALPLAKPAAAASSGVLVTAPGLAGYWSVIGPNLIRFDVGPLTGIRIIYSGETDTRDICLINYVGTRISATCSAGMSSDAGGGVAQGKVVLKWWNGPSNLIFNGQWDRKDTIEGGFSGGFGGIQVTGHVPAVLEKLHPGAPQPPSADNLRTALADLRNNNFDPAHYEPSGVKRVKRAAAWPGASIAPTGIRYLGGIHIHWQQKQPDLAEDVYEVHAGNLLSLCRIAVSPRGLINDFACQADEDR